MNIFQTISTLRTARSFEDKPVDEKMIGLILYMGTHAISAGNFQEWEFIVVEDKKAKEELSKSALDSKTVKEAPSVIVICANVEKMKLKYGERGENFYALQDTGGVVMLMALITNTLNLGFDIVKSFDEGDVRLITSLPEDLKPVALMPIGYAKELNEENKIIPFEDLTHVNRYGNKIDIDFKPIELALKEAVEKLKMTKKVTKEEKMSILDGIKRLLG